jgi:hypothetical protein
MMWKNYELGDKVLELDENLTLCRSDRVLVSSNKGTLAVAVKCADQREGLVLLGHGRLVVDAIVETEDGALGKPIDRELSRPFLMLGDIGETSQHLKEVSKEDVARNRLKVEEIFGEAQNLIDRFLGRRANCGYGCHHKGEGLVIAFVTDEDGLDVLVLNGSRLVFRGKNISFVAQGNHSVLTSAEQVVFANDARSVIVEKPGHRHGCC